MKTSTKQIVLLFFFLTSLSYSQTNITNKDYEVTNDVVKIEEYNYFGTSILEYNSRIDYTSTSFFKDGFIQKQLNDGSVFIVAGTTELNYSYLNKEYKINNGEYVIIEFAGLKFSANKENFKILKQSSNYLELESNLGGKIVVTKYNLTKANLIEHTAPYLWFELKKYYNQKGQLIQKTMSKSNAIQEEEKYSYDNNELLEKIIIENFTENSKTEKHYEYELDEKGNWIKRIEYKLIPNAYDEKIITTRKLTFKNGDVRGSYLDYNNDNFFSINPAYFVFEHPDDKVKGCISGDCQNGFGKKTFNEKDVYEGNFSVGLMSGKGTYSYGNGTKYEGDFISDSFNGQGKLTYASGDIYEGSFIMNKCSGFGTYTWANGDKYEGVWKSGERTGKGILTMANGDIYEGDFMGGHINGQGKFTYSNGDLYEGSFINDERTGQGIYTWANNNKYAGEFKNGKKNGKGTYFDYVANKKYEEVYEDDKLVQTLSTTYINTQQVISSNTSKSSAINWTKNTANTEYWLYNNGVLKEGQTFWVGNSLYVHMQQTKELYFLENFKTQTAGPSHAGVLLPFKTTNGFWYKNNAGGATAYNNKCEEIKNLEVYKYTTNGIDVLLKGKAESETLLLKNFKTAEVNKIYPAEIYKPTTTSSPTSSNKANNKIEDLSFQAEIESCKLEESPHNCIFKKFNETHTALKKSGIDTTTLDQKTISNLNAIGKYDVKLLFNVLFKSENEISKLTPKLDADVKLKLKAYAQKIKDDYAKTHTNEVPESLKNSVRKQ